MAPNMLSRLHLRRPPSTPSSPVPGHGSSLDLDTTSQTPTAPEGGRPQSAKSASSSHLPSTLSTTNPRPIPNISDNGGSVSAAASVSGVPLVMYRSAGSSASSQPSESHKSRTSKQGAQAPPPPIDTSPAATRATLATRLSKISSFVTPTDNNGSGPFGKRPGAGKRMASEPANKAAVTTPESAKSKKSIPFLKKHSVSNLWARRKTEKNPPDITPLSSSAEPTYDPRIRGTKVHDFSAPRPKRTTSQNENVVTSPVKESPSLEHATPKSQATDVSTGSTLVGTTTTQPVGLGVGLGLYEGATLSPTSGVQQEAGGPSRGNSDARSIPQDCMPSPPLSHPSPDEQQQPDAPRPPVQLRDDPVPVPGPDSLSEVVSQDTLPGMTPGTKANASVRTARSRNLSKRSIRDSALSGIPKHMKSTSSRFSFDMMGSADEEKALEERHRQRQREKGGGATSALRQEHDSRFDDLEEEDFDYDAMMDDDGLEEPIPGVNADYDDDYGEEPIRGVNADYDEEPIPGTEDYAELEEPIPGVNADYQQLPADDQDDDDDYDPETDPDNDQENFAGFEFQRSNKSSGPITPHSPVVASTPSNETDQPVASSVTEESTPELPKYATMSEQAAAVPEQLPSPDTIRAPITPEPIPTGMPPTEPTRREEDNELYFDNGLADELDFQGDGTHFDENLFDLDDTDQYGRPIPGAFARAAEQARARQLAQLAEANTAAAPGVDLVQSTTDGSMHALATGEDMSPTQLPQLPTQPMQQMSISGLDMAYQAALAEAAQRAAESGKFRRSSSPAIPEEPTVTSPTDSALSHDFAKQQIDDYDDNFGANGLDGYEDEDDDGFGTSNGLDDYEFDDEDIIAEANASALANDSDGWYGQEFGFYSAPLSQSGPSSLNRNANPSNTENENPFQYSYGGYFGPAGSDGVFRSKSGRVVCREPTLTPITETSEYSNRNSIMSLNLPPSIDARNSTGLQSPTLAQLALMDDDEFDSINKLRKKTWAGAGGGGGGGGGGSMLSSREGSPRQERRGDPMAQLQGQQQYMDTAGNGNGMGAAAPGSPFAVTTGGHFGAGLSYDPKRSPYSMLRPGSSGNGEQGRSISPTLTNKIQAVTMPMAPGQPTPMQGMGMGLGMGVLPQQQQPSLLGPPVLMPVVGQQQQVPASGPVDLAVNSPLVEEEEEEEQYQTSSSRKPLQENTGTNGTGTLARKSSLAGSGGASQVGVTGVGVEQQEQKKKVVGWA